MARSERISRNDPCSCGSGKKYKRCCEGKEDRRESRVTYYAGMAVILLLTVGGAAFAITLLDGSAKAADDGRVWSEEHGHFHNADGSELGSGGSAPSPATRSGPPSGPPPAGKVWSSEHGHWHDAPAAGASAPSRPVDLPSGELVAPRPPPLPGAATPGLALGAPGAPGAPGAAPPGKVWSTEHGHWHDAPAGTKPGPAPAGPPPPGKVWSTEHGHWHDAPGAPAAPAPTPSEEVLWSTGE